MKESIEAQDKKETIKTTRIVTLKPPDKKDHPKNKKKTSNKEKNKKDDNKTRKISDIFGKKSTDKNNEKSQDNRKVQRQEASKEAKNVSSSQQDCNDKPAPLDSVEGVSNILDNIPDSILNKKSAVKPDLAEN